MSRAHGTRACYVRGPGPGSRPGGCRCNACCAANRLAARQRNRSPLPAYVDAQRARLWVRQLQRAGLGLKAIARAAGVPHGSLSKLIYGDPKRGLAPSKRIRPDTERRILGVTPRDGLDRTLIDAAPTLRHIDTLLARGWTKAAIARAIGKGSGLQIARTGTGRVRTETARAIEALLDQPVPDRVDGWGNTIRPDWTPEAELAEQARLENQSARRAHYRAAAQPPDTEAGSLDQLTSLLPGDWVDQAVCSRDPDIPTWLFFPSQGDHETIRRAKAICATCPVRTECLNHAIRTGAEGIWGGTTDTERAQQQGERAA